jgi:hypothetical protein
VLVTACPNFFRRTAVMVIWQFPLQVAELDEVLSSNALYEKMSAVLDGQHITSFAISTAISRVGAPSDWESGSGTTAN